MTELPTERSAARPRPRKPGPVPTVLAALAVFGVAFEFLAFQLTAGKDPAVGTGLAAGALVTRPAKKLVITKVIPARGTVGGSTSSQSSSGSVAAPAPVTTSSS